MSRNEIDLTGCRVLITGAARGIGALTAKRLYERGARLALLGIEPDLLEQVAADCDATWHRCDVSDRRDVDAAVAAAVAELGGLDVLICNAGIAAQLPLVGGDAAIFEKTMAVNTFGTYYVIRAAGEHVSHTGGYVLLTASLAAAVHVPLLGAYSASKAAVEALGNTLRGELQSSGARVGVAYYAELDTDMTTRGFATKAAQRSGLGGHGPLPVTPVEMAIDAIEAGIRRRSRRVVAPRRVAAILPLRMPAQRLVDLVTRRRAAAALEIARTEEAHLTTPQPEPASLAESK
jgi:NAD(P)-dependent dehydrogenase (short-subunit alcohol dehydrogenase family)